MPYNLVSPNGITQPCDPSDLDGWFACELSQVGSPAERAVLLAVTGDLDFFVRWAANALLLWPGCIRVPVGGARQAFFRYPPHIKDLAREARVRLDARPNGPAMAAFILAGGERPPRFGSSNAWSIHHLYSGKFPHSGKTSTTHAIKEPGHFTQSAGLVAVHPVADALCDEFPFFAWYLRAKAYDRFRYDPDGVFSVSRDAHGFGEGGTCRVVMAAASGSAIDE